jgi:hypothetical protein
MHCFAQSVHVLNNMQSQHTQGSKRTKPCPFHHSTHWRGPAGSLTCLVSIARPKTIRHSLANFAKEKKMATSRRLSNAHQQARKRKYSEISKQACNDGPGKKIRYDFVDTTMWTTVKRWLEDPAGMQEPSVECPVCQTPIAIRGVPGLEPDPWRLADGSQKVGVVLPCAHFLCKTCFNVHFATQKMFGRRGKSFCPCCRADLVFPECEHTIPPQRLPVATSEHFSMIPRTIPELAHQKLFPRKCWSCTSEICEEYIKVATQYVLAEVHGIVLEGGIDLVPRAWSESLTFKYLSEQRAKPNWRNGSVHNGELGLVFADHGDLPVQLLEKIKHLDDDAIVYDAIGRAFWYVPVNRSPGYHWHKSTKL